jgi:hypothetical protein
MTIYWTIVSFGPCSYRPIVSTDLEAVKASLAEDVDQPNGGATNWTQAHTWIRGYATQEQAEAADCSDSIGQRGRVV